MQIIWRTAMSIDAKLASPDHRLDFLDAIADKEAAAGDFPAFLSSVDAIILGATTLRWLLREGHGWPHGDKPTWLVTHDETLLARVGETAAPLTRFAGDLAALVQAIERAGARRVWLCGGGDLAGQLLAIDRIDEIEVTVAPLALGAGPSLFGDRPLPARRFDVQECRAVAGNAVLVRWVRATGRAA
jgi:riboflavin biosynthesis pyrimidine reductase